MAGLRFADLRSRPPYSQDIRTRLPTGGYASGTCDAQLF